MDLFFKGFLTLLILFEVLAFAGTAPWAFAVFQGGIFILSALMLFRRGAAVSKPFKAGGFGFLFLIFYTLLQACFTTTFIDSVPPYPSTMMRLYTLEHVSIFTTWLCLFFIGADIAKDFKASRNILWVFLLPAVVTAVLNMALPGVYLKLLTGISEGVGPFVNRNHGGCFLAAASILCAALAASHFALKAEYLRENKKNDFYAKQLILIFIFLFLALSAVFTRSRGAMTALAAGITVYAVCLSFIFLKNIKIKICALLLIAALGLSGAFAVYSNEDKINAFAQRSSSVSTDIRKDLYRSAFEALKERPVFGTGAGALPVMITNYTKPLNSYIERLHSDPLEILLGAGIAGFLPLLICAAAFIIFLLGRIKALPAKKQALFTGIFCACISFCISSAVDFSLFIPACASLFFTSAGLLCGVTFWREEYSRIRLNALFKTAVLLFLAACFWFSAQKAAAWRFHHFADGFKFERKTLYYQKALAYYPSPRYALSLGVEYYNKSLDASLPPEQRAKLRKKAFDLAETYLKKYPREKELSKLYMNAL